MRLAIVLMLVFVLAACSSDAPDTAENGSDPDENRSVTVPEGDAFDESQTAPTPSDETIAETDMLPIPDPANESANLSEEWIVGIDESGDPIVIEPRARLNESYLGIVPSSDPTPRIVSFSLIAPSTNRVIKGFENMTGTVRIDRERVPRRLAVRANYAGEVGSVLFSLGDDENHRVENAPPFALHGVDFFGNYDAWVPDRGRYPIRATPFEGSDGIGMSHEPVTLIVEFYAPGYLDRVSNP